MHPIFLVAFLVLLFAISKCFAPYLPTLYSSCWNSYKCRSFFQTTMHNNCTSTNFTVISNLNISDYYCTKSNINIFTNNWRSSTFSIISNTIITMQTASLNSVFHVRLLLLENAWFWFYSWWLFWLCGEVHTVPTHQAKSVGFQPGSWILLMSTQEQLFFKNIS